MSFIHHFNHFVLFAIVAGLALSSSYPINETAVNTGYPDSIDLSTFGKNAFIEPDVAITGKLVAEYRQDSSQNPEELGTYFEGDILMPSRLIARNGLVAKNTRWPNGVVPYEIVGTFSPTELEIIAWAFDEYHTRTCIKFKPRLKEKDYISIVNGNSGCWSAVGRTGGKQEVNLQSPQCLMKRGTILHELMHVLGFIHEQNRHERDKYITVRTENIRKNMLVNFAKSSAKTVHGLGIEYDYTSVMHYSPTSFSKNGKPTIEAKRVTPEAKLMGQRSGFSTADVAKINLMYKCKKSFIMEGQGFILELDYSDGKS